MLVTAPVPPGRFLFVLKAEQIPDRYAEVLGDLVGCGGCEVFFSAHF